jgi:hypothetical protein
MLPFLLSGCKDTQVNGDVHMAEKELLTASGESVCGSGGVFGKAESRTNYVTNISR